MTGLFRTLLTGFAGGSALAALGSVAASVCAVILGFVYRRYVGILGADRRRRAERQDYDALRNSLAGANLAARLYAQWLTTFLDQVDRFFGDAGMADRTLFPRAFGLRAPAPLWTAPAFDRCLVLASIYPIATIFIIWVVSGHVGPAEAAIGLKPALAGWQRLFAALGVSVLVVLPLTPSLLPSSLATKSLGMGCITIGIAGGLIFSRAPPMVIFFVITSTFIGVILVVTVNGLGNFVSTAVAFSLAFSAAVAVGVAVAAVTTVVLIGALAVGVATGRTPRAFTFGFTLIIIGLACFGLYINYMTTHVPRINI